jgi:flagellar transcriptional activator FlhC
MTRGRSVVDDAREVRIATELIELGARVQVLEAETGLSRERLLRLYKEIRKKSPPRGMLPFSTDWFMTWLPNVHSSLFMQVYQNVIQGSALSEIEAIIHAYRLYLEYLRTSGLTQVLSFTRAWRLVKFVDAAMLRTVPCTQCGGHFVVHTMELYDHFVCGLCRMPSRAGQTGGFRTERRMPAAVQ